MRDLFVARPWFSSREGRGQSVKLPKLRRLINNYLNYNAELFTTPLARYPSIICLTFSTKFITTYSTSTKIYICSEAYWQLSSKLASNAALLIQTVAEAKV